MKAKFSSYDAEYMYNLRYEKKNPNGFEQAFELANHLITKHEYYRTNEGNFNFIFSGIDSKKSQWDFLYGNLPLLLLYILQIESAISRSFINLPKYWNLLIAKYTFELLYINDNKNQMLIETFQRNVQTIGE